MKKTNITIKSKTYYTYLMEVEYDKNKEETLKNIYIKTLEENPDLVYKHNGLYEKDMLKWISFEDLQKNILIFRPFYRKFIKYILDNM